jgi:nucleotide-binding universal stress UspA family protein
MSAIVVGVDGSPAARAALTHALEEGRLRDLPLRIVAAWEVPGIEYAGAAFAAATPDLTSEAEHAAEAALAEALSQIGTDHGVTVETVAIHGHPAQVLLEQARDATLLVVGTRGRNTIASIVLGSVSQALAHHCPTPLMIVPDPHTPADSSGNAQRT